MPKINCPTCNRSYELPETHIGKQARCKACQTTFVASVASVPVEQKSTTTTSGSLSERTVSSAQMPSPTRPKANSKPAVAAKSKDWGSLNSEQRIDQLMKSFSGEFTKPKTRLSYRIGLLVATLFMLAIPIGYLACIAALGYGIYLHCITNHVWFTNVRGRGSVLVFLFYIMPPIVGIVLIVFLLKPFLARGSKEQRIRSLSRQGEPVLFAHIDRLCKELGAPVPTRIDIMNEVNAAAGFRNGLWSMIRGNDLVLKIGMPLVSGLSLQQLTGVLAHEFGHFSQGAGMRMSRLLMLISEWLRRAVYDRDAWDEWLVNTSHELDIRLSWIIWIARGAIWFSRKILWCFLMVGYFLVGYVLKQMEYDADRYEAAMVGKSTFAETSRKMQVLSLGFQSAMGTLQRVSSEGKIVDDIPKMAWAQAEKFDADIHKILEEAYQNAKSVWYESHPCDRDRVNAISSYPDSGRFQSDFPARALFQHFEPECKGVTSDFYDAVLGKRQKDSMMLVPTSSIMQEVSEQNEAWQILDQYFLGTITPTREFSLPHYQVFAPKSYDDAMQLLNKARSTMKKSAPHYRTIQDTADHANTKRKNQELFNAMKRKMSNADDSILNEREMDRSKHIDNPNAEYAHAFVKASMIRLHTACCLSLLPEVNNQMEKPHDYFQQMERILPALSALDPSQNAVLQFAQSYSYFIYLFQHFDRMKGDKGMLIREALHESERLVEQMKSFRASWRYCEYPFDHGKGKVTIAEQITPEILDHEDVRSVANAAERLIDGYHEIRGRCLSTLAVIAKNVEKTVGLPDLEQSEV
ncbi:MAG: M48 family metalloprotease [Pirellula sp.]|jgi:Zn-dependent protease with chaperone function|nr:M48 family metalloprotease [Pirellula sp.]